MSLGAEIFVILLLTVANGFFAGAEIAMLAVRKGRLLERADQGSRGASVALGLRAHPERFLATVQVGITIIGSTAAAFGGATVASRLGEGLNRLGLGARIAADVALAIVVLVVSSLTIVFGELVPKSLALRNAEKFTIVAAPVLEGVARLTRPIVWLLTEISNLVLRPFGDRTTFGEARLSPEEIQQLVEEAATEGTVDRDASELASRALDLPAITIEAVRVPRNDIVSVRRDHLREDLLEALSKEPHERYPVIAGGLEDAIGYVVVREIAALLARGDEDLASHVRTASFFPETRRAIDVMREMQKTGIRLGLVVDDQGAVTGIVTLENLLEELVGEILREGETTHHLFELTPDGTILANGKAPIREVNRAFDLDLPETGGFATIAGLAIATAGRIPRAGAQLEVEGMKLEVLEASPRRVLSVRIHPKHPKDSKR